MERFKVYIDGNGNVFCQTDTKSRENYDACGKQI